MSKAEKISVENIPELPYATEEAVNRLRININFLGDDIKKILVVSSVPNEGKSFVAMHLWHQMVKAKNKSILVDMDLRKSVIIEDYGLKIEGEKKEKSITRGTSDYLAGKFSLEDTIYHTDFENGDLLPNMKNVVNPSILLENRRFEEMFDKLAEQYQYVFIDSPPLGLVSDSEKIGSMCDGAILVVRSGGVSRKIVKNSASQLQRAGCPLLGVVLNRVHGSGSGYYSKRYGGKKYYYGYGRKHKYYTDYYASKDAKKSKK
ncbi:MAG: CpsD/CapB family tyrosine-protein kinase [Eubacterium sp.]|nr:CpsD/CapB family tyrosine-protein kinase [Eubacterium sp.]